MNIYSPIAITEQMMANFKPARLYIKRHTKTNLKYFGKTVHKNIDSYYGSGRIWQNHIKCHGKDYVVTDWVSNWFTNPHDLQEFSLLVSEVLNIVESTEWANIKPEYGVEGHRPVGSLNGMYQSSRCGIENPFYGKRHTAISKSKMGPTGQVMPDKQRQATKLRMLKTNPMNNPKSVQKIRDSMVAISCILCREVRHGVQNLEQHYNKKCCCRARKRKGLL